MPFMFLVSKKYGFSIDSDNCQSLPQGYPKRDMFFSIVNLGYIKFSDQTSGTGCQEKRMNNVH